MTNQYLTSDAKKNIDLADKYGAHNYHPLQVVITKGEAEWVWDIDGKKYLDMLSAYSAVNQGHCHPKMQETLHAQGQKLTLSSRAFHNDQMGPWLEQLTSLCKMDKALPMNTGAEAVETAIKIARKWGYLVKGVPRHKAEIIVCDHNFHGRTTTIVSFSSEPQYKDDFGPYCGGFRSIPYGDAEALEKAITPNTVGFLFEPIQGEAGIIVPPVGYLEKISAICKKHNILCIADEIQTGLGRTGKLFAHLYENCQPDLLILGKALGGSYYPISAVVGYNSVMDLLKPGDHGSTFGGNSLACALSRTALKIIQEEKLSERAFELGKKFRESLADLPKHVVKDVRGKGLLNAIEIHPNAGHGRFFSELLQARGLLAKETHDVTIRFAPPLVMKEDSLNFAISVIKEVFSKTQSEWQ
ncbi:ornithine--oxo-acid transaminase [Pigmentibacter sp. JX0631]|uniref:ornithine--oxo-acid transaminase n=1 Tax=Pigmentibacter sp. JX0631 TaxID=2976982 RepID=UPI0024685D4E|nr:ornithine--oxo-acid transaminase [Pigmentibacter sp. JX0631]WGL60766.1 ornithine--oxo-acid transaminase [Pigmentibacter sp. JX0631]